MNSFAYNTTGDSLLDAASALLAGEQSSQIDEAALKEILPTKENKQRLESFMKKFNALRDAFPDVVIHGTHDEKVEARLLDNGNVVQYLAAKIPSVYSGK